MFSRAWYYMEISKNFTFRFEYNSLVNYLYKKQCWDKILNFTVHI